MTRSNTSFRVLFAALLVPFGLAGEARAKVTVEYQGFISTDFRIALPGKPLERQAWYFTRNENQFNGAVTVQVNKNVGAKAEVKLTFLGFHRAQDIYDLTMRDKVDPYWFDMNAAYVELRNIILPGLDLRIGRQIIKWGTADQFNPTDNINPYDYHDPLQFGESMANQMIKVDYNPLGDINVTMIWIPLFRAARLPDSTILGLTDPMFFVKRFKGSSDPMAQTVVAMTEGLLNRGVNIVTKTRNNFPDSNLSNSQFGARVSWKLADIDMSLSYYYGFGKIPRADRVYPGQQIDNRQETEAVLAYPRIHAVGYDLTSQIPGVNVGIWGEVCFFFHDDLYYTVVLDPHNPIFDLKVKEHEGGMFFKLTAGMDYTFTSWLMANAQYVRGFVDEFGNRELHDYIILALDFTFFDERLKMRLVGVLNINDLSNILYPEITWRPWSSTRFILGAILYGGKVDSKFGEAVTGSSRLFMKARVDF